MRNNTPGNPASTNRFGLERANLRDQRNIASLLYYNIRVPSAKLPNSTRHPARSVRGSPFVPPRVSFISRTGHPTLVRLIDTRPSLPRTDV